MASAASASLVGAGGRGAGGVVENISGFAADDVLMVHGVFLSGSPQSADEFFARALSLGWTETELKAFRARVGHGERARAWDRTRSLGLCAKDGLVVDGKDRVLLPVEAFGIVIDIVAVDDFVSREKHRGLNPETVLKKMGEKFIAGGHNFGAVLQRHVEERLVRASLDGGVPSLSALLRRIEHSYDALAANLPRINERLRELYTSPRPTPAEIVAFAAGRSPCLIVPASSRVLWSLPLLNLQSSSFSYSSVRVLLDGCECVEYACSRARAPPVPVDERSDGERADGAASTRDSDDDDDEGGTGGGDSDASSDGGGGGNLGYADSDNDGDEAGAGAGAMAAPPSLPRSVFASAALGVRHSSLPIERRAYGVSCNASLLVFKPPLCAGSSGESWLLVRGVGGDNSVVLHAHALNEHLPTHPALETVVSRELVENGSFSIKSKKVSDWVANLLDSEAAVAKSTVEPSCAACSLPFHAGAVDFLCQGGGCASPQYHASCISAGATMCDACVASGAPLSTAPLEPELQRIVESSGLAEDDHRALLARTHVSVHDVHRVLEVPRSISCFKPCVESLELRTLVKTIARVLREHNSVSDELMNLLQAYKDAGWGDPEMVKDKTGKLVQMNCPWFTPHMREACYLDAKLGDETVVTDDSFNLVGNVSNVNVFACMAPVASAGGATMPIMIMLYLTGSGIEGDMAHALSRARKFLFKKRVELYEQRAAAHAAYAARGDKVLLPPPPQPPFPPYSVPAVQFFDKSASSFLHAFEDARMLAASEDARAATAAVREALKAAAAGASAVSIAAAAELLAKLPGINSDGSVRPFDIVPPSPNELAAMFPEAFPAVALRSTAENRARFGNIFTAPVIDMYGAILDGLAHVVEEEIGKGVDKLLAAQHSGDVNEAAARLLPVHYVFARDSTAADALARYFLHITLLCDFHAWKAIERKLSCLDGDLRGPVLDAVRDVISKGASWNDFKERFKDKLGAITVSLDSSEKSVGDDGARVGIFEYFEKHWLSPRWRSTVDGKFRALIEKYGINTTNDVELFWNTLKNNWTHGLRRNPALALALILGKPPRGGAASATDSDNSYLAQRWSDIESFSEGRQRLTPRASRDTIALSVSSLLTRAVADPSLIADNGDGSFTIGNQTAGFVFKERADDVRSVREMNSPQLLSLPFAKRATSVSDKVLAIECGRTKQLVKAAVSAAQSAARDDADALFTQSGEVNALLECVLVNKQRPPEFDALAARAVSYAQLQRAAAAFHPNFVDGLLALLRKQDAVVADGVDVDLVAGNQALHDVLLSSWALLERTDFAGAIPHVALIYAILLTMTAKQWLDEYERIIVKGERVSLVFGDSLPLGYRIALVRMARVARAKSAKTDDKLTDVYFGQEHRGKKSKGLFGRAKQHTTVYGSLNICQLQFQTAKREGFVVTPPGNVTLERRLVAMLPAGDDFKKLVNAAEALVFLSCARVQGFVALNDSPPGELRRLLKSNWAGPPRIVALCTNFVDAIGGEETARTVRLRDVADKAGPFLLDALACVHLLMEHGHYVDVNNVPLPADFRGGGRAELSKFSVLTLVTALVESVDDDGGVGGGPSKVYKTFPWCNACSCPYVGPLCKHLVVARIITLVNKRMATWHGSSEALYWRAGPAATYSHRITSAPTAESSAAAVADAAARAVADIPGQAALLTYHAAIALQRCAEGDETVDVGELSEALKNVTIRLSKISRATLGAGGAGGGSLGKYRKAARNADSIDRDRAEGLQLRATLTPSEMLARLDDVHPLPDGPQREAARRAAAADASAAWGAAAHAALGAAALGAAKVLAARAGDARSRGDGDGAPAAGALTAGAGAGGDAVMDDGAAESDDSGDAERGAGAGEGAGARAGGGRRAAVGGDRRRRRSSAAADGADDADEVSAARPKRAATGNDAAGGAGVAALTGAATGAAADAPEGEPRSVTGAAAARPPIHGLRGRAAPLRRAELGLEPPAVKGGVDAGADTSQPSRGKGAGLLYPGTSPFGAGCDADD